MPPLTGAKAYERDALFSYQTMILIACVATLSAMAPLFISWYALALVPRARLHCALGAHSAHDVHDTHYTHYTHTL